MLCLLQRRIAATWFSRGVAIGFVLCWILSVPAFARHSIERTLALSDVQGGPPFDPKLFGEMRWRCIGPFRGGRTVAISGVPHQPNVFYMAAVNGGVWKTTDFGNTWNPIFDDQPTGSVGALAVAPSDPNVIYVGSGEGLQRPDLATGDGIYKSTDAGKTWMHLGLRDAQQIAAIIVDPKDPNRLFVAAVGHPYGPNAERGVFRSTDGGKTFQKILYKDENTGAADLELGEPGTQHGLDLGAVHRTQQAMQGGLARRMGEAQAAETSAVQVGTEAGERPLGVGAGHQAEGD